MSQRLVSRILQLKLLDTRVWITVAACLVFVLLWSSGWIGSKYGQDYAGAFTLLALRYAVVVVLLGVIVFFTRSWRRLSNSELLLHISVGVLSHAVYLGASNSAFDLQVSAGMVAFITALLPMITSSMSSFISGEKPSIRQWSGLVLGFAAVLLVISDKIALGGSVLAYSLPFIGIFAFSVATLLDRRLSIQKKLTNTRPTPLPLVCFIHCLSAFSVLLPIAFFAEGFSANWNGNLVFSILWLAIVVSLGAYGLMFIMLRRLSAIKVASLEYLAPPATMIIAFYLFNERLSLLDVGGLALAGVAVALVLSPKTIELPAPTATLEANSVSLGKLYNVDLDLGAPFSEPTPRSVPFASTENRNTPIVGAGLHGDSRQLRLQALNSLAEVVNQEIQRMNETATDKTEPGGSAVVEAAHRDKTNSVLTSWIQSRSRHATDREIVRLCHRINVVIGKQKMQHYDLGYYS